MTSRTWALTLALVLVAVGLGAWTAVNAQTWSEAADRQDDADAVVAVAAERHERLDAQVSNAEQALSERQAEVSGQRRYFTPEVLAAVSEVQSTATDAACQQARAATRDGNDLPAAQVVVDLAVAGAASPALADLDDRWAAFIGPAVVQTEIDACAADEAALIEAELAAQRSRNCGAPLFPEDSCPTDAELAAEQQAEALCGGGHYDQAAALGIDCGPVPSFP